MDMGNEHMVEGESSWREYFKFGLVIAGITGASMLAFWAFDSSGFGEWLRWFMGVFFLVFACFKFIGYEMFAMMFGGYDLIAKRFSWYGYAYPFIELFLGFLYLLDAVPTFRDLTTLVVMGVGTVGVAQEIRKRSGIHCACLGNVIKLPLSTVSLVEDVSMSLMALVMLFMG